jgi:mRNA interferase MazF
MKRFDVWLVMKNPEHGRVVDNLGLCTILTPEELKSLPSLMVAPMTTSSLDLPTRVKCNFEGSKGYIMVDQIRVVEKSSFIKKLGELELEVQVTLSDCLQEFFVL